MQKGKIIMKKYQPVQISVIFVENEDILTNSLGNGGTFNSGSNSSVVSLWDEDFDYTNN